MYGVNPHPNFSMRTGRNEQGFALVAVVIVMALLGVLGVAALATTGDERRAAHGVREGTRSFYTAEAGLNEVLANWDLLEYDTLIAAAGDSLDLGWQMLPVNGASYRAVIQRVDNGGREMFSLTVEGRGTAAGSGQRVLGVSIAKSGGQITSLFNSAVKGGAPGNSIRLRENEILSGRDTIPAGWGGVCSNPTQDVAGIVWGDTAEVRVDPPAGLEGNPLKDEDATIDSTSIFDFGDFNYDDLVAIASNVYTSDVTLTGAQVFPVASGGTCVTVRENWGAPEDPAHPCFEHFPIIHVQGKLWAQSLMGQGIILADDEVIFDGSTKFYGLVLTGRVRFRNNATVYGALLVNGDWDSRHFSTIRYSQCAIARALEAAGVIGEVAVVPGSWTDILR